MSDFEEDEGGASDDTVARPDDGLTPEFPPGLFVEESTPVVLPPQPVEPATPVPAVPPVPLETTDEPEKKSHRALIIVAIVVVVAVVATLLVVFQPWMSTGKIKQDFTDAAAGYQQAQTDLTAKIADAETLMAVNAEVADPTVMDHLSSALNDARSKVGTVPDMADGRKQIREQTSQLESQTKDCNDSVASLDQAMKDVTSSRVQYATDALTDAVTSAQTVLDQSAGNADESARSALAVAIQRTQAIIAGLNTADPSTFAATISEQQASLQKAVQDVLGAQGTTCDNDVDVPSGVNPIVCQSMPTSAIQTMATGGITPLAQFSMPSGNIGCTKSGNAVECEIVNKDWTMPADIIPACPASGDCGVPVVAIQNGVVTTDGHTDVPPWTSNVNDSNVTIPVLQYGQIANFSPVACLSDEDGVICWDTTTHHGFQMNRAWFVHW